MDPNFQPMTGPLVASMMQPQSPDPMEGFTQMYLRHQATQNARPNPTGAGTPLVQSVSAAKQGVGNPYTAPINTGAGPSVYAGGGSVAPRPQVARPPQSFNNAGVTLGDQYSGGRNVQVIRGTQSSVEHFNENGDNTGVLPNAQPANIPSGKQAPGMKTSWQDQMKLDERQHTETVRRADAADRQLDRMASNPMLADPAKMQALQADSAHHHALANQLGEKLYGPHSLEEYQAGYRNQQAEQDVAQASAHTREPVQMPSNTMSGAQQIDQAKTLKGLDDPETQEAAPAIPHPPAPGAAMPPEMVQQIYHAAGMDPEKARQMIQQAGWTVPGSQQKPYPKPGDKDTRSMFRKASDLANGLFLAGN